MQEPILLLLAVIPPFAFLFYVMRMDSLEPEPWGYIMKVLLLGGLSCVPAGIAESLLGTIPIFGMGGIVGAFIKSFFLIAPVEELAKLMVVLLFVWKNKNFNEENDGVVYVGTAAIGFAMAENIMYVFQHGMTVGIARALTAIPLHTFSGVIMGYYTGKARFAGDKKKERTLLRKGFLYAYGIHGLYDTFALSGSILGLMILPLVVMLFVVGIRYLKKGRDSSLLRWGKTARADGGPEIAVVTTGFPWERQDAPTADTGEGKLKPAVEAHKKQPVDDGRIRTMAPAGRVGVYKIILSRLLLGGSLVFWVLLSIGYFDESLNTGLNLFEYLMGGTVLTIIPILLGVVLEISYHRNNRPELAQG
ncbi:MAG TPA: PrsW family intramembrane metalloprotease [Spirochaetes bacterium]|nr:PrsW family intramembrane metalloprotease [Spirochaetota bacterium]